MKDRPLVQTPSSRFQIGSYRPIYLWAGPGTIRMNRLKFLGVDVDESVHNEAHTPQGADLVVNRIHCNWVHLMYNWGFPPEIEKEDWAAFEQAASFYHHTETDVFAYIQTSNCVYDGSFQNRDWYALDPHGKKITYFAYSGRYMACLGHPDWRQHLKDLIRGAIQRGADGIFFDNLFQGTQTISIFNTWLGSTGCHCLRCQQQHLEETGEPIPTEIRTQEAQFVRYLRWRADQVTHLMAEMRDYAHQLQPGTPISANNFDAVLRNSYLLFGLDLEALAQVQDVTMIENLGLPCWERHPRPRLANNALTIRTARAMVRETAHLSVLSYDVGIGFDPVYPARRYQQGIAEAAACGTSMTTKGTEYFDGGKMTLLTASQYASTHAAIGQYHAWLQANSQLFAASRENLAPVALLYPGEDLWLDWHRMAPLYFGAGQVLTAEGVPWRVVRPEDSLDNLRIVLAFDETSLSSLPSTPDVQVIFVPELESWRPLPAPLIARNTLLRNMATLAVQAAFKVYSDNKLARSALDRAGLPKIITQTLLYHIPAQDARETLIDALPSNIYPRLRSQQPALIEVWRDKKTLQVHLVNYSADPQSVQVQFESPIAGFVVSPHAEDNKHCQGTQIDIALDVYKILLVTATDV